MGKLTLLLQVLTGKRKHPYLSFSAGAYRKWCAKNEPRPADLEAMEKESGVGGGGSARQSLTASLVRA